MDTCPVCCDGENFREMKTCAGCMSIAYCSSECQRKHWKVHKKTCCPFKITFHPIMGKQCVATRDLKAGTLLLHEQTKLYFPKWVGYEWVCLSCGIDFNGNKPRLCSTCNWPICSSRCEQEPIHRDNECNVFSSQKIQFPPSSEIYNWFAKKFGIPLNSDGYNFIAMCVVCTRGLRLKKLVVNGQKNYYQQLMDEYFNREDKDRLSFAQNLDMHLSLFTKLISVTDLLGYDIGRDELRQFVKVVNGNNFIYHDDDKVIKRAKIGGSFVRSSRFNHSCTPNAASRVLPFPSVKIRTITAVKKGQPLTIEYLHTGIERMPKSKRQELIWNKWSFKCQCQRCLDPTELGTFMDGVSCLNCRPLGILTQNKSHKAEEANDDENCGYFLPINPLDFEYSATWKCNNCEAEKCYGNIQKLIKKLKEVLDRLTKINQVELFEEFAEKNSMKVLHPNHWILVDAAIEILKYLANSQLNMNRKDFDKFMKNHDYVLSMVDKYAPGISDTRANTLRQASAWLVNTMQIIPDEFTEEEKKDLLLMAMMYNEEALLFFDQDKNELASQKCISDMLSYTRHVIRQKMVELNVKDASDK